MQHLNSNRIEKDVDYEVQSEDFLHRRTEDIDVGSLAKRRDSDNSVDGIKMTNKSIRKATCHCSGVELELVLPNGLEDLRRCNCSMCRRRGAIVASVPLHGLKVTRGQDLLALCHFNTGTARHYFRSTCGIYTHHQRRSNPEQYGFNVACLEGVNPFELGEIPVVDGANHPCDR